MAAHFEYYRPTTWDEAATLLQVHGPEAKPLAGGTDLMLQLQHGVLEPRHVVALDDIPDWNMFSINGAVTLSAGTTYRQIEKASDQLSDYTVLVDSARQIGSVQVRNVATVAGGVCNASPASDAVPPLLVLDATLMLCGPDGERVVPVNGFVTEPGRTILKSGELLRQINIPQPNGYTASTFFKAGFRKGLEVSLVCVATRLTMDSDRRTCKTARIALGAVAPMPVRAIEAEQVLNGAVISPEALDAAAHEVTKAIDPITDFRASSAYREHLAQVMTRRGLAQCYKQISEARR